MKKKKSPKQIAALVCVILLAGLYLFTFVCSLLSFPGWQRLLSGCLIATVALPILLWVFIWLYGQFTGRHTIASFDLGGTRDNSLEGTQDKTPSATNQPNQPEQPDREGGR